MSDFTIRNMHPSELCLALDWAQREGWNPGLHDAACFYAADPRGFFIGLEDDKPVGCISAVRYGEDFGFLGLYIVDPARRGCGYGERLAAAGMDYLAGRTMGLDGVVAQQENYRQAGFGLAHRNMRYLGLTGQGTAGAQDTHAVVPLSWVPFAEVATYDHQLFPAPHEHFLHAWISQPDSVALGAVENDELHGYGVMRTCREGYKIGPLFADDADLAERLFLALTASVPTGRPVYLDIPEVNPQAQKLVERHRMEMVFETARMYSGPPPQLPLERVFGITSFELG
ncbi:GNAT family N-acetyltransferase [Microbulbifer sp. YPW16]|uniref:GNAT family N-acetyltransferase n=1 Tax=Microbulbifer sp. YPW16 TaxID=2904242 RepID=UPI001E4DAF61|nr:GNAT family N-acetyltransferase [Microbulbifer sp. YPW16]UHQ54640.1 GNAT family N-acetyltransferase [Microbulbifer sp. YPW16]